MALPPTYTVEVYGLTGGAVAFTIGTSTLSGSHVLGPVGGGGGGGWGVENQAQSVTIRRGRSDPAASLTPGECTIVIVDPTGRYNPASGSSLAYSAAKPGVASRVRVSAVHNSVTYYLFYGHIRAVEWRAEDGLTVLSCADLLWYLGRRQPTVAAMGQTTTGAAIGAILDAVGWTDPAYRSLETGDVIPSFSADGSASALSLIEGLLATELGNFYQSPSGVATFIDRRAWSKSPRSTPQSSLTGVTQATAPSLNVDAVVNRATVTRTGGAAQSALDAASATAYGDGAVTLTSPYLLDDSSALYLAQWLVTSRKEPRQSGRFLDLTTLSDAVAVAMLARDLYDHVQVTEAAAGLPTTSFTVVGVTHAIRAGGTDHRTTWSLVERTGLIAPFRLDISGLDGPDPLVY